jgi:hypothetical protein
MSPTPAPRVVAGGVASSFRNRSAIERCRYRSDSLWPRWNLWLWIGCDIPSYARPRARALQSVKALFPVGGARSATQQKGARWGIASSLSATRVYRWKRLSGASKLGACEPFSTFVPIHFRESPASPKPPSPRPCMESKSFTPIFQSWDARSQYGIAISGTATGLLTPAASLLILKARRMHSLSLRAPRDARHHASFASRPTLTAAIAPTSPELPPNLLASESYISRIEQRSLT